MGIESRFNIDLGAGAKIPTPTEIMEQADRLLGELDEGTISLSDLNYLQDLVLASGTKSSGITDAAREEIQKKIIEKRMELEPKQPN